MKKYRTELKPVWCKGCGNYGILDVLTRRVLRKLQIPNHQVFIASGIGCSSRAPGYIDTYSLNSLHGRALTIAQGAKLAAKLIGSELKTLVIGGDGDLFSIGAGHLPHAVRRNIDITCIMVNNFVYALTKGQTSPTTPFFEAGEGVAVSEDFNPPVDPILDMLAFSVSTRASFIAQGISTDPEHLSEMIEQAILHKGFSFIDVLTPCVTFTSPKLFERIEKKAFYLKEGELVELPPLSSKEPWLHNPSDMELAMQLAQISISEKPYFGVFFKGEEKEDYITQLQKQKR